MGGGYGGDNCGGCHDFGNERLVRGTASQIGSRGKFAGGELMETPVLATKSVNNQQSSIVTDKHSIHHSKRTRNGIALDEQVCGDRFMVDDADDETDL